MLSDLNKNAKDITPLIHSNTKITDEILNKIRKKDPIPDDNVPDVKPDIPDKPIPDQPDTPEDTEPDKPDIPDVPDVHDDDKPDDPKSEPDIPDD